MGRKNGILELEFKKEFLFCDLATELEFYVYKVSVG